MSVSISDIDSLSSGLVGESTDKSFNSLGMSIKFWLRLLLILVLIVGIAGCGRIKLSGNEQLPVISALPPPKLPDWIEKITPLGEAEPLSQIRIQFKDALIPIESLDNPEQQRLLQKFEILPPLPGHFRFLTPRMVGFQADKALPKATRVKITLKSGLADLKSHQLNQDLAWTFNTEPIKLTNLPTLKNEDNQIEPIDVKPTLKFNSNVELDLASIQSHLKLIPQGQNKSISLKVDLQKKEATSENTQPQENFDLSIKNWTYTLKPQQTLEKATPYRLEFSPGLRPVHGNLLSELPTVSQVITYSPLNFKSLIFYGQPDASGAYGRFVKGSPQLQFNNGILADSAIENIKINPAPKQVTKLVQAADGENLVSLNPWAFEPTTNYTITIGYNLKDKFGQTLGKPVTLKYETGDVAGDMWVPSGLNIFPAGKDLQLNITTINLPESQYKAAYRSLQPTDLVYVDSAYPKGDGNDLLPQPGEWQSFKVKSKKNESTDITVPITEKLGTATGMLAYGVYARPNRYQENGKQQWREVTNYGLVQLSNLGVFAQWFPDSGLIRVHHLADGSPVAAASVEIYESKLEAKSRPQPVPCATGKTDQTGTLQLNREDLKQCIKSGSSFQAAPQLLVIARENQDWAFVRTEEYSGAYGYGVDAGWDDSKPVSRGTIFSDRQLYQPGEKVWLTAIASYLQNGTLKQDQNASYTVTLLSPSGQKTDLGTQTTNEFGTFSLEVPLKATQPLGYYSIQAKGKNGVEISGDLRVAEFKPPNFKVDLALDKEFAFLNQKVEAKAQSNYLFGTPVEGGKVQYYVTRSQTDFIPKGWEQFSFGRKWFWPEETPTVPTDVLQSTERVLDANGKSNQTVNVGKDLPYPMTYRVDVQVADVSNLSVSDSKTFMALPSDRVIGLSSNFVADAGKAFPIQVIVTDPTGKLLEGQRVRVELQQIKYSSVTRVVEGSQTPKNQVEYKTVGQAEVTSSSSPQSVSLTPSESGSYRIRANFADTKDEVTATDLQIWATGDNAVNWGSREGSQLEVKLDKETYKVGDTATALIQSPYPEAELYFAVVRDKPLYKAVTKVKGGAPQIQFQVTPEMLPNAAVEAVLIRQGVPLSQVEPGSLENLVRIGFAPFKTNLDNQYLKVTETLIAPSLQPGTEQTVQLELKDAQGNPVKGQFTVMAVNEAVLQLSGYRPPDLVKTVYAEQAISTRFSDNRPNVVLQPASTTKPKGWGYGGGQSSGAASTRIRKDFQALAYYNGSVLTDAAGKATVTFKLPDDLTTWRVMAVATDGNLHFGNAEATFITTKPLLSNPILPQFARPGDRLEAGLSVTNNTGQTGNLAINGAVTGSLQFADNKSGSLQTQTELGTRAYRFPIIAGNPGTGNVQFTTQLNGTTDAFAVPLEVKPLEVTEQVVETGTTNNQVKIPLNVDRKVVTDAGGLEVSLASTLIPEMIAPAKQVLEQEDLPFLEPTVSQLAIATHLQTLSQKYGQSFAAFNPTKQATQSLERLQKLQLADGGFATIPGETKSDPLVSPYAAETLARVTEAFPGLTNNSMVARVKTYLKKILAAPPQEYCSTTLCKNQIRLNVLMALVELGEKRNDFLADIYAQRSQFDPVTQMQLTRYLSQFPEWQDESQALWNQLQQNIYQTGRTASVNLPAGVSWLSSPTTAQAEALRLAMVQNSKPEVVDRLLQSLLGLRRDGTWQSSYDNAQALTAVVAYSQLQPTPPNFATTAKLAGKQLVSTRFQGYTNPSQEVQVPIRDLPRDRHDLILNKSGQGTLHYLVAYRYRLQGNQPGRFNGLRVVRDIRLANQDKVLRKTGLYDVDEPLTLASGQVFDIGLEIITDHPVNHVVITDPLPAGFEAVDASFKTATAALQAKKDQFGYKTIYRDRVVAYSDRLEPGVYSLQYLVRSVTPGKFLWPGAEVHLQYAPEEFGRSADSTLVVSDRS
jgi:uncharacterized protein YfaS (alpha-2-macroglobulin family)